ncbi:unnamed protein product [Rhodiola kirilowii]
MSHEEKPPLPTLILPLDIISDVLSRLRPKELLRFKVVSKEWLSLISDPNFVKQHLRKSITDGCLRIVVRTSSGYYNFPPVKLLLSRANGMLGSRYENFQNSWPKSKIVGSCHGLICLTTGENEIFVWNPALRKSRKLPKSGIPKPIPKGPGSPYRGSIYGFGYDEVNDDYNVVMIGTDTCRLNVEVYSMKSNRWRRIGDAPYWLHHEAGLSVCGTLVWSAMSSTFSSTLKWSGLPAVVKTEWKIVALDLESGSYRDIPQSAGVQTLRDKRLGVLDGCVCIFAHCRGTRLEIWIMKEFGVQESWTKLATVPYLVTPTCLVKSCWMDEVPFYMPLWCSRDGEMMILFRSNFILYNMRDGTFKYRNVHEQTVSGQGSTFIESLVSPCM